MNVVYCSPLGSFGILATGEATLVQTENSFSSEPRHLITQQHIV
jgi:hypothetical protein